MYQRDYKQLRILQKEGGMRVREINLSLADTLAKKIPIRKNSSLTEKEDEE